MSNAIRKAKRYAERHRSLKARLRGIDNRGIIVYGAGCVWWDVIENAARTRPPSCPFCGSVLFQFDSERAFWFGSEAYEQTHPGYIALTKWLKGKCFKTMKDAAVAYELETGIHYETEATA